MPQDQPIRRIDTPRYIVQGTFPDGLQIPVNGDGVQLSRGVVERNTDEGVTRVHSYVSEDKTCTFCVLDAPTPEAIRKTPPVTPFPSITSPKCGCSTPTSTHRPRCTKN